jgi:hypothetical protein
MSDISASVNGSALALVQQCAALGSAVDPTMIPSLSSYEAGQESFRIDQAQILLAAIGVGINVTALV